MSFQANTKPTAAPEPPFEPFAAVFARLDESAFASLAAFASRHIETLDWQQRLDALELAPDDLSRAVASTAPPAGHAIFGAFTGSWIGSDLHDSSRAYRHIWYPTVQQGPWAVQPVLMLPLAAAQGATIAYDAYDAQRVPPLRGVVDGRPYVGFALPGDGLLWFGAEHDGAVSLHAERVVAGGRLYEIRGVVLRELDSGELAEVAASDWRYHRVTDGAIAWPHGLGGPA